MRSLNLQFAALPCKNFVQLVNFCARVAVAVVVVAVVCCWGRCFLSAAACVQVMRKLMHKVQLQMDDSGAFGRCLGVVCPQ